jgi:hypothetical protein
MRKVQPYIKSKYPDPAIEQEQREEEPSPCRLAPVFSETGRRAKGHTLEGEGNRAVAVDPRRRRATDPRVREPPPAFAAQLLYEPLIPVERSPLVKRAIADLLAAGSGVSTGLYYFGDQPHLMIMAGTVIVLVRNAASLPPAWP